MSFGMLWTIFGTVSSIVGSIAAAVWYVRGEVAASDKRISLLEQNDTTVSQSLDQIRTDVRELRDFLMVKR